jgi:hypothetical protein
MQARRQWQSQLHPREEQFLAGVSKHFGISETKFR